MTSTGILYLVATPIGNREDITLRALRILKEVDRIAAEDTRHSGQLLAHLQISTPLISYHEHNQVQRTAQLLDSLQAGESIALISDAGMPGISDPGAVLIQVCIEQGIAVVPIPGPTAVIAALVASGLPMDRFVFEGFLPHQPKQRQDRLAQLRTETRTLVFYEAPHRLERMLGDLQQALGSERAVVVAREITKRFETFWRGTVAQALAYYRTHPAKGEITLVVAGADLTLKMSEISERDIVDELRCLLAAGHSRSQASRQIARQFHRDRREIYQLALTLEIPEFDPESNPEPDPEFELNSDPTPSPDPGP